MLYQLHWQNLAIDRHHETEFVAQAGTDDFPDGDALRDHFVAVIERRKGECPKGWGPLIMDETCEHFVWAAPPADTPTIVAKE